LPFDSFEASCRALKKFSVKDFLRSRYPLAILAGFLLAASFPNLGVAGFGWLAPGLIVAFALGGNRSRSFRVGYVAGVTHYLVSLYWLLCIPVRGFPILGWIALSAFLALYPSFWTWLVLRLYPGRDVSEGPWTAQLLALADRSWTSRTAWALSCAAIWVALEMMVARFLGGFPWNLLGASQYRNVPLIQIASLTGVYGISFLLVWTSVSLLNAAALIVRKPQARSAWLSEVALPLLAISAAFAFGFHQLRHPNPVGRELNVTLLQPSIPQTMIWNPDEDMERFRTLIRLSEQGLTQPTDLLIWPEAAIPRMLRYYESIREPILALARSNQVWMIVGSDDGEPRRETPDPDDADYYNSSFLISPEGLVMNRYRKRSLVIFGEYIPLERTLPFLKWFTPVTGSFTPGDKAVPFELEVKRHSPEPDGAGERVPVNTAVLICFEDNFPHLVREYVTEDTDFLVNITNNGWFGESAAQWQHAANAIFRAIENGVPLIRCSNNGLTCWVDAHGRLREVFRDRDGRIYGPGYLNVKVPLGDDASSRPATVYHRYGDWFGWSCVAFAVAQALRIGLHLRGSRKRATVS
jgi:apolipoprotein N-acyltransferase